MYRRNWAPRNEINPVSSKKRKSSATFCLPLDRSAALAFPNTEEDPRGPSKLPVSEPESASLQRASTKLGHRKRMKPALKGTVKEEGGALLLDALPQDRPALTVPIRNFSAPLRTLTTETASTSNPD